MRANETPDTLPPEAIARMEEERRNHMAGVGTGAVGALVALIPLVKTGDITMIPAIVAGVCLIVAGNLIDPERFNPLTRKALDKLPGRNGDGDGSGGD